MSRLTLPMDLLVHALAPFFRLHAPDGDETGANQGHRLLQVCRMTQQQKEQATEHMRHREYEFTREVEAAGRKADVDGSGTFGSSMLGHAMGPCMRLMQRGERPPPPNPLLIDTGQRRRMGRDWRIADLVVAVLRHGVPPTRVVIFTTGARSASTLLQLIEHRMPSRDVLTCVPTMLVLRSLNRVTVKWGNSSMRGISADLLIVNDVNFLSADVFFQKVVPFIMIASVILVSCPCDDAFNYTSEIRKLPCITTATVQINAVP